MNIVILFFFKGKIIQIFFLKEKYCKFWNRVSCSNYKNPAKIFISRLFKMAKIESNRTGYSKTKKFKY